VLSHSPSWNRGRALAQLLDTKNSSPPIQVFGFRVHALYPSHPFLLRVPVHLWWSNISASLSIRSDLGFLLRKDNDAFSPDFVSLVA